MRIRERNGVRVGQKVVDLDGVVLGRVTYLFDWGFEIAKGLPFLFRSEHVLRYDEVRGVRDGQLVAARSPKDLFDLAAGRMPATWRIPAPPGFPTAATPSEARDVFSALAGSRHAGNYSELPPQAVAARRAAGESLIWHPSDAEHSAETRTEREPQSDGQESAPARVGEREYVDERGQGGRVTTRPVPPPAHT
jgi:hypothetical protein